MKKHLFLAPFGLCLIGAGVSMAVDAGFVKSAGGSWFLYGTLALIVLNSGVCVFGRAVVEQLRAERRT
jgi:hypothetical protein